jgi:hypothetical protein
MKKLFYISTLIFALVLMNTSCEKQNDTPDDPSTALITLSELNGTWNFQLLQYAGLTPDVTPATTQAQLNLNPITKSMRWINLSLKITVNGIAVCDLIDAFDNPVNGNGLELNTTTNIITLDNGLEFQVLSYDKTTKILKAKLIAPVKTTDNVLDGATYTFKKQ